VNCGDVLAKVRALPQVQQAKPLSSELFVEVGFGPRRWCVRGRAGAATYSAVTPAWPGVP